MTHREVSARLEMSPSEQCALLFSCIEAIVATGGTIASPLPSPGKHPTRLRAVPFFPSSNRLNEIPSVIAKDIMHYSGGGKVIQFVKMHSDDSDAHSVTILERSNVPLALRIFKAHDRVHHQIEFHLVTIAASREEEE